MEKPNQRKSIILKTKKLLSIGAVLYFISTP